VCSFENPGGGASVSLSRTLQLRHSSMECWNQVDMDVSGRILATSMPAIHAGMTMICIFMFCGRA